MDGLTGKENQKRGSRGALRGGKQGRSPKWTCASEHLKAGGTLSETSSAESTGAGRLRTFCGQAVVQGGRGWRTLRYSVSNKLMSGLPCLVSEPRPAPRRLGVWLMTLSAASIAPLHHPLLPGWPCNVGSTRRPGHYRHVSTRQGHYGVDSGKASVMRRWGIWCSCHGF